MSAPLSNGAVLPTGLLSENSSAFMEGFNKSYKNFPLRVGVVIASYPPDDDRNRSGLTIEYDVVVIEQNADKGATTIMYRNCMSSEGLGSIADYFEKSLRFKKNKTSRGDSINTKGQDGAIVLMLCLDGMSDKGIIIGALTHPDRDTNLVDDQPRLVGVYNGIKVMINPDGSCSLVFEGATDNQGNPTDSSQGTTTLQIQKDGSFQADNDAITFKMDRTAQNASLTAKKDINMTAQGNINLTATGNLVAKCKDLSVNASGKADVTVGADCNLTASGKVNVKGSEIDLNGAASGITTMNSHQGVIDLITGVPVQPSTTTKGDV